MTHNSTSTCYSIGASIALSLTTAYANAEETASPSIREEVFIWGKHISSGQAGYTNPTSVLLPEDMESINIATTEDVVKYEPSLVIRRRFIGDANGTLGIRGSNMFQTSRSMVFADGVPLHYFLQTRWSGAPRWTMVSASEIAQVEVIYGPFSAEYSGNAMGGVVEIETAIPQEREIHLDTSYFSQDFSAYRFDDAVSGYKAFASYGDKFNDLSLYLSFNHLENEAQPQTFFYGNTPSNPDQIPTDPIPAIGGVADYTEQAESTLVYGDTGVIDNVTDNFKIKLGYDSDNWRSLLNIAYEDRNALTDSPNTYLRDHQGTMLWSGPVRQSGYTFNIPATRFGISEMDRRSLSAGLRIKGDLTHFVRLEANLNRFAILEDETRTSGRNPQDPKYSAAGSVHDFDNTGWQTAEVKLSAEEWGLNGLAIVSGLRYESYELNTRTFSSDDYTNGSRDEKTSHSGGKTELNALFVQFNWTINDKWDASLGGRLEHWRSHDGYFHSEDSSENGLQREAVLAQTQEKFSPKLSVGYQPTDEWVIRYSLARAYRFPIVEELFLRYRDIRGAGTDADPTLEPEAGIHHNLMLEKALPGGYIRMNLFQETIKDVIENQTDTNTSVTTFFPIDEVKTLGVEWIINAEGFLHDNLDIRFNVSYMDSEIVENTANPDLEGNEPPRMPDWRGNMLATYHLTQNWNVGGSVQYASDSFGRADNTDSQDKVYGAQDGYTRFGLKTNCEVTRNLNASLGIDNITDQTAYVAHPWPGRTWYFNVSWKM